MQEMGAKTPCVGFFRDRVLRTICLGWLQTEIFLISGVSHQHLAFLVILCDHPCNPERWCPYFADEETEALRSGDLHKSSRQASLQPGTEDPEHRAVPVPRSILMGVILM
jgi:hypothetical protein